MRKIAMQDDKDTNEDNVTGWKGAEGLEKSLAQDPKGYMLDGKGKPRTTSLFYEWNTTDMKPLYTLRPYEFEGLPSIKQLYMAERDLTGYIFANKHLYDYEHFLKIKKGKILGEYFNKWEEELELLIRAEAVSNLVKMSETEGALGLQAAKFVSAKGWDKAGKGRPTKEDIAKEAKKEVRLKNEILAARQRVKRTEA